MVAMCGSWDCGTSKRGCHQMVPSDSDSARVTHLSYTSGSRSGDRASGLRLTQMAFFFRAWSADADVAGRTAGGGRRTG